MIYKNHYFILAILVSFLAALIEFFGRGFLHVILPYAVVNPILVLLSNFIFSKIENLKKSWFIAFNKIIFFIILLNIPGSLFLHDIPFQYDRFLHFVIGFLVFQLAVLVLLIFFSSSKIKVILFSILITFIGLFAFEGFQYLNDVIFGTHLFFDTKQNIVLDFWEDITLGSIGLILSAIYIKSKYSKIVQFLL